MAEYKGPVTSIPETGKGGDWKPKLEKWRNELVNDAGERLWHPYAGVGSSTSSNLKRDYGVEAESHTIDGELTMFVRYPAKQVDGVWVVDEDRVKEIRAGFKANQKTADNGNTPATTTPEAQAPAAGRRNR